MILSDRDIKEYMKAGKIKVEPCDLNKQLGSVGIDLRLSNAFRMFKTTHRPYIDLTAEIFDVDTELIELPAGEKFIIHPGEFVLGMTMETVELGNDVGGRLDGRSSLGRVGIIVHSTAGRVEPGWKGRLTLEITNIGKLPIALLPGMRFCCLMFEQISTPVEKMYRGKYQGATMPTTSKINEELSGKT